MLKIENLSFTYQLEQNRIHVLKNLSFKVEKGDFIAIQGPSGSGKSTLFYILGLLLRHHEGKLIIDGRDVENLTEDELCFIRNQKIGFIFQQFHLLPKANVLQNILLPTHYPSEWKQKGSFLEKAMSLIQKLGLDQHVNHFPHQLSGGQQQRVAIARALIHDVDFILADEPTGNLDSVSSQQILDLLSTLHREGKTILMITHDHEVAAKAQKTYHLKDGVLKLDHENVKSTLEDKRTIKPLPSLNSFSYFKMILSLLPLVKENLFRNKIKSFLTMLGVVMGVSSVMAMITLGKLAQKKIISSYEVLGVNKLTLRGYENWTLKASDTIGKSFNGFDMQKDIEPLRKVMPEINLISPLLPLFISSLNVLYAGLKMDQNLFMIGVSPDYLKILQQPLLMGRNLNDFHIKNKNAVCVVGYEINARLSKKGSLLNEIILISDEKNIVVPCKVIGILSPIKTSQTMLTPNLTLYVPYTYLRSILDFNYFNRIQHFLIQIKMSYDIEKAGKKMKNFFENKYGKSGFFSVDEESTLVAQMKRFLNIFKILLISIASISLIVGGIGIHNMMLVSVNERLKEFGIRKALGASPRSLRTLVLLESLTLCSFAGILGLILGFSVYELLIFLASHLIPHFNFEWVLDPLAFFLSFLCIGVVGILSGLSPALKSEKLEVIECLRSE